MPIHDAAAAPLVASFEAGASDAGNPDTADESEAVAPCTGPHDCLFRLPFGSVYCCIDHVCTSDVPKTCPDGIDRPIRASNYDQSCTTDTDCVGIDEGSACSDLSPCGGASINRDAYAKYQSDTASVPCFYGSTCGGPGAECAAGEDEAGQHAPWIRTLL